MNNEYLYHYTKMSTGIEYILKNFQLKINNYGNTNDPFESKDVLPSYYLWGNLGIINQVELIDEFNQFLKKFCFMSCFTEPKLVPILNEEEINFQMWAQYGENQQGLCFCFDKDILIKTIEANFKDTFHIIKDNVSYKNYYDKDYKSSKIKVCQINANVYTKAMNKNTFFSDHFEKNKEGLFLLKDKCWEGEKEFRIALIQKSFNENDIRNELLVNISDCLKEIILGANFKREYIPSIRKLIEGKNINLKQISVRNKDRVFIIDVI